MSGKRLIITDDCIGCTICMDICDNDAIYPTGNYQYAIDCEKCTFCRECYYECPEGAIVVGR